MSKVLFVLANEGFQDTEFGVPHEILKNAGIASDIAAKTSGLCHGKFGAEVSAKYALAQVSGSNYDAVIFIGGPGAMGAYHGDREYFRLALEAKLLAAICIAPTILSDSGIFIGKKVTGWDRDGEQKRHIAEQGGIFIEAPVVQEGHIITANGPEAAAEFGAAILTALEE